MTVAAEFIRYLENNGLARLDIRGIGDRPHSNRVRIQKCAFIAKEFGLRLPYKFDVYIAGPHSTALNEVYYELHDRPEKYAKARGVLSDRFDAEGFHRAVDGRSTKWLANAAILIDRSKEEETTHKAPVDRVKLSQFASKKYISGVLSELEGMGLVRLGPPARPARVKAYTRSPRAPGRA